MKVSIIVPIYNAEKYLRRCIDSILASSYQNIEILLLDDGSCDNSLSICREYQKKYKEKIKVYSHKNMGVARTRNKGLQLATGTYVMFVDNDDFIKEDYIEKYYQAIREYHADLVMGGYQRVDEKKKVLFQVLLKQEEWSKYKIVAPWAKMYRLSYLKENQIEFLDSNIGEDIYFNVQAVNHTDKIVIIDCVSYQWFYNKESVSNTLHKKIDKKLQFEYLLNETYQKVKDMEKEKKWIEYFFIKTVCWYLFYIVKDNSFDKIENEKEYYMQWLGKHFPNYQKNKYLSLFLPKGESFKNRFAVVLFIKGRKYHMDTFLLKILNWGGI